jgi:hypothetical protein
MGKHIIPWVNELLTERFWEYEDGATLHLESSKYDELEAALIELPSTNIESLMKGTLCFTTSVGCLFKVKSTNGETRIEK